MTRIPRDISATDLVKALKIFGYTIIRQTGSHMRLTTQSNGTHHITVPNHKALRLGTLAAIVDDVAQHFAVSRDQVIKELFEN
ncbi:MAG: type II toxin-antitoxin system HicA family toxin [Oligoflexia bacterium]|nr:type II toxin-antitoxin system HicA family toxin [Oligoflexia bacterium]